MWILWARGQVPTHQSFRSFQKMMWDSCYLTCILHAFRLISMHLPCKQPMVDRLYEYWGDNFYLKHWTAFAPSTTCSGKLQCCTRRAALSCSKLHKEPVGLHSHCLAINLFAVSIFCCARKHSTNLCLKTYLVETKPLWKPMLQTTTKKSTKFTKKSHTQMIWWYTIL